MAWTTQRKHDKSAREETRKGWKVETTSKWHEEDEPEVEQDEDDYDRKVDYVEGLVAKATVQVVQLDGLVLLKIIKHASEKAPEAVAGLLLGLDIGDRLEATNCFPIPVDKDEEDDHQFSMMKALADVNVDNNTVGWYQSALLGTWCNRDTIEEQFKYQTEIPNSVVVVYDPSSTTRGRLALKAYRLTAEFMELFASGDFSHTSFSRRKLDSSKIFEEIPIKVHNSHLVHGFLYELREQKSMSCSFDRLHRSSGPFLTKTLGVLSTHIDDYCNELNRFTYGQRSIARYQKVLQEASSKHENKERIEQGLDPLDENGQSIKPPPQPSRLETFLIQNMLRDYCDQMEAGACSAFRQLYITKALQPCADEMSA